MKSYRYFLFGSSWIAATIALSKDICNAPAIEVNSMEEFDNLGIKGCRTLGGNITLNLGMDYDYYFANLTEIKGSLHIIDMITNQSEITAFQGYYDQLSDTNLRSKLDSTGRTIALENLRDIGGILEIKDFASLIFLGKIPSLSFDRWDLNIQGGTYITGRGSSASRFRLSSNYTSKLFVADTSLSPSVNYSAYVGEMELFANGVEKELKIPPDDGIVYTTMDFNIATRIVFNRLYIDAFAPSINAFLQIFMHNLEWVPDAYITRTANLQMPVLHTVNNSLHISEIQTGLLSLANLTNIGTSNGRLVIEHSPTLLDIQVPALKIIRGDLNILNNTALRNVNGFKGLVSIEGNVNITGPVSRLEFPLLENVNGSFIINSADFNCTLWNQRQHQTGIIKGDYTCNGGIDSTHIPAGDGGGAAQKRAQNHTTMIAGSSAGAAATLLLLGVGVFYYYRRFRSVPELHEGIACPELESNEAPRFEVDGKITEMKVEAPGIDIATEVPGDFKAVEMYVPDMVPVEIDGVEITRPAMTARAQRLEGDEDDSSDSYEANPSWITDEGRRRLYTQAIMISRGRLQPGAQPPNLV